MPWFTASIIQSTKFKDPSENQDIFPVYENYVLIEADSVKEAFEKAEHHAKDVCAIDDQLQLNGKPAYMCFEGIRKLIEVSSPLSTDDDIQVKSLCTGVELSYSYMEVVSQDELDRLAGGRRVRIDYIDADESD